MQALRLTSRMSNDGAVVAACAVAHEPRSTGAWRDSSPSGLEFVSAVSSRSWTNCCLFSTDETSQRGVRGSQVFRPGLIPAWPDPPPVTGQPGSCGNRLPDPAADVYLDEPVVAEEYFRWVCGSMGDPKGRSWRAASPNQMQRCVRERQDLSTCGTRWPRTRRLSRRIRTTSSALLMFEPCHVLLLCLDCSRGTAVTHLVEFPAPVHSPGNAHDHPHQGGAECRPS